MKATAIFPPSFVHQSAYSKRRRKGDLTYERMPNGGMHFTQLSNIAKDRTEIHNLAREKPDPVPGLTDAWYDRARHTGLKVK